MTSVRIGTSGWLYPSWRGVFYPAGLAHRRELAHLSSLLDSVEVNATFYRLQRPQTFQRWHDESPAGFTFAVKGPRFVTHIKRLTNVQAPLANFFASGVLALGDKLGPVLWQLPPQSAFDPARLEAFLQLLPRTTGELAVAARGHDERMTGRALLTAVTERPVRHALEVRHPSFVTPAFTNLLRDHDVASVVADTAGRWPMITDVTADPVYVRLHGDTELYTSGYGDEALERWAGRIRDWSAGGRDVVVYFDNDVDVHAPFDALRLAERIRRV